MNSVKKKVATIFFIPFLCLGCAGIFSEGEAPESIVQPPIEANNINVIEPVYGVIYNPGDTLLIKWLAPTIKKINIQIFRKSDYKFTIAENIDNSGKFGWIINYDIQLSNHYVIKILSNSDPNIFNFSQQFGIQ